MKHEKGLNLFCNIAFWIFIGGMALSMFKPLQPIAVLLLLISILLFLVFGIVFWVVKLSDKNKKNGT